MRVWQTIAIGLLAITFSLPAWADAEDTKPVCGSEFLEYGKVNTVTLSIPAIIIANLVQGNIEVKIYFRAKMTFQLYCDCEPCCPPSEMQVASLTVSSSMEVFGGRVSYYDFQSGTRDPQQGEPCELWVTLTREPTQTVSALGFRLEIKGVKAKGVTMEVKANSSCECTSRAECFDNTAPRIASVDPEILELKEGESATFTVVAIDPQKNHSFPQELAGGGSVEVEGWGKLPKLPATREEEGHSEDEKQRWTTYSVNFPNEGEELEGVVVVKVKDVCGQAAVSFVPVRLLYPPTIILDKE